jgi:phosphoglycerate dehydrogenase-like enzyme
MSRKIKIGFTADFVGEDGSFFVPGPGLKLVDERLHADYGIFPKFLREVTPEQIRGFDMIVSFRPLWKESSLVGNNQLLSIHRLGVGYERLDVPALTKAGIILCITPKAIRRPMATSIITLMLALSLRLTTKEKLLREGRWAEVPQYKGWSLEGKTLGSIGVGNIGHDMFRLAKPFDMKHIAYDPYAKEAALADADIKLVDLDTVLAESDILNISCPLTEETRHMIGEKELRKMKKVALLINTARGPIIDEPALIKALQEGWVRGAGLDVFEQEPPSLDNPLFKLDNVILTPHALCWTNELNVAQWEEVISQMSQIIKGEIPESVVNPEAWNAPQFRFKMKNFQVAIE